jgi:PAS domain S-box-containing protein
MHVWVWIALGALTVLVIVEQLRIFKANREFHKKDEIFQAVTENAADMIALVDVKGRRLYNSPAYKRVLGYSPSELSETSSLSRFIPTIACEFSKLRGKRARAESASGSSTASSTKTEAGACWNR